MRALEPCLIAGCGARYVEVDGVRRYACSRACRRLARGGKRARRLLRAQRRRGALSLQQEFLLLDVEKERRERQLPR